MAKGFNTVPFGLERVDNLPFLKNEIFDSYEAAESYASTDPTAYAGQSIGVVDVSGGTTTRYTIQQDKTLKKEGGEIEWQAI